jgi:pimeloyl-ACP methyl ester carboxylesterase
MKKLLLSLILVHCILFGLNAQFQIGHATVTFNDPTRSGGFGSGGGSGRQIQTEIYYPASIAGDNVSLASGDFPVIVFGHGFAMSWEAYTNIWEHYIPLGYIIAFPRTEGGLFPVPSHNDFALDLNIVEQRMLAENVSLPSLFYQKINGNTAIMGHSMGGGATILAAASNTSIETIIGLAPAETSPSAISAAVNVTVPALIFSGENDGVTPPVDHHIPIYNSLNSDCKSIVTILGGAHCYFANSNFNCDFGETTSSTGISISRIQQQNLTYSVLDLWLDYKLKNNASAGADFLAIMNSPTSGITTLTNCSGLSISENESTDFTISPNPTKDKILIENKSGQELTVKVYNHAGEILLNKQVINELSLSDLSAGLYFVAINGATYKVIKN